MAEVICATGATAAISQLVRYGFEIVTGISGLTRRIRHTPQTLRSWNTQANNFVGLIDTIQVQVDASTRGMKSLLDQCREDTIELQLLIKKIPTIKHRGKLSRLKQTYLMLWNEKNIEEIITSLSKRATALQLHLIMLKTTRIEDQLGSLCPSSPFKEQLNYGVTNRGPFSASVFPKSLPRNDYFVGMTSILRSIYRLVHPLGSHPRVVVSGAGGVGKSEVVAEFVHRLHEKSPEVSIFWLNGASEHIFAKALSRAGRGSTSVTVDGLLLSGVKTTKSWFESNARTPWLMIVDNADVDTFFGPNQLHKFLPHSPRGCILVLTRNRQLALRIVRPSRLIVIGAMVREDARKLLLSFTGQLCDHRDADDLVSALELSPLAIAQVGAFIAFNSMSIRGYLCQMNRTDESASQLFLAASIHFSSTMHCTVHSRLPIASLSALRNRDSDASDLLAVAACFGEADIPLKLLSAISDADQLSEALLVLRGYSLAKTGSRSNTIELSWIVRVIVRAEMTSKTENQRPLELALRAMCLTFPAICEQSMLWERCRPYQLHAQSILAMTMDTLNPNQLSSSSHLALAHLASALCSFLIVMGHHQEVRTTILKIFGWSATKKIAQQGAFLDLKSKLAISEQDLGNLPSAMSLSRETFLSRKHALENTHSKTLHSLNNLALIYEDQGFHDKAERYHRESLSLKELIFGNEHLDTLTTANNLGITLQNQTQYQAAELMFRRSLSGRLRVLPLDDLDVLTSQSNLGVVFQLQGRLDEAEKLHRAVYNGRRRVLGDTHNETMKSKGNLAITINDTGNCRGAEALLRSMLDIYQHTIGKSHPDTLKTQENLAMVLHDQSKFAEAEALILRMLPFKESIRGQTHIGTLETMEFLSIILQYQQKYAEAVRIATRVRDLRIQHLGRDHSDSCRSMGHVCELEEDLEEFHCFNRISPQVCAYV